MEINYLAILACGVAAMVIGFIWYGTIFKKAFQRIMCPDGMTPEQMRAAQKGMVWYYILQFILALVTAGFLSYHMDNFGGNTTSVGLALCIWFGFVMTTEAGNALWSGRPAKHAWQLFLINASGSAITFAVFGWILSMM